MKKIILNSIMILSLACISMLTLSACGTDGSNATSFVSGTASGGAALVGNVTLKDSQGVTKTLAIGTNGSYNIPVSGLTPPYIISAGPFFSFATGPGIVNLNPFTTLALANAAGTSDLSAIFNATTIDAAKLNTIATGLNAVITNLNTQLAPVYTKYNLTAPAQQNFYGGAITIDAGIDALFALFNVQVTPTGITAALASAPNAPLFSANASGAFTIPANLATLLPAQLTPPSTPPVTPPITPVLPPTGGAGSGSLTLSGAGSIPVGTGFTPAKATYYTEPTGPFGSVVFTNNTLILILNLAKQGNGTYAVAGINFQTVAMTNYSPDYEWDTFNPLGPVPVGPSITPVAGVTLDTTTKQVTFTNVTLNDLSQIHPNTGTITLNGSLGW
jgi:hypothetical protein